MMAVQRLALSDITTIILQICGYSASTAAPWASDANLYKYINLAGQNIPIKVGLVLEAKGRPVLIDFWKTTTTSATSGTGVVVAAASATGYLPVDCYYPDVFYDLTNKKTLYPIRNAAKHQRQITALKNAPAGPPEAIELLDMVLNSTNWQQKFTFLPATATGVTPSIQLDYYRMPASMAGSNPTTEYPDCPVEFEALWIYGPVLDLMAPTDPKYDRYKVMHDELIQAVAAKARVVG